MICVGLLVMWCNLAQAPAVDSFCAVYQPVVQARGDGTIKGTLGAKQRILANERTYRKVCSDVGR